MTFHLLLIYSFHSHTFFWKGKHVVQVKMLRSSSNKEVLSQDIVSLLNIHQATIFKVTTFTTAIAGSHTYTGMFDMFFPLLPVLFLLLLVTFGSFKMEMVKLIF